MEMISSEDQQILDSLQKAVTEALERKKRLGQYAVIWRDGRPVTIRGESVGNEQEKGSLTRVDGTDPGPK